MLSRAVLAGASTQGLPPPQYGELKNFGYVPKPGQSVIMRNWQKYIPTGLLQTFIPMHVLAKYLDKDTLALLQPTTKGVQEVRTVVGWQMKIPAAVVEKYVPLNVLSRYVPTGVVLAASANGTAGNVTTASTQSRPAGQADQVHKAPGAPEPHAAAVQKPISAGSSPAQLIPVTTPDGTTAYVAADQLHATPYALQPAAADLPGQQQSSNNGPATAAAVLKPVAASTLSVPYGSSNTPVIQPAKGSGASASALQPAIPGPQAKPFLGVPGANFVSKHTAAALAAGAVDVWGGVHQALDRHNLYR